MTKAPFEDLTFGYIEPFLEAEHGDFRKVADMIERGEKLPQSVRILVADFLRGDATKPARRTRQQQRMEYKVCRQVQTHIDNGLTKYAAINSVADETQMPVETIKTYLRKLQQEFSS